MKPSIHPNYVDATVICSCGNTFETRSTRKEIRTDLCSVCHPFYTGEQRIVDTAGQVERFMKKVEAAGSDGRTSKRQQRLAKRSAQMELERERQAELAARSQAEEDAARAAARAAAEEEEAKAAAVARAKAAPEVVEAAKEAVAEATEDAAAAE